MMKPTALCLFSLLLFGLLCITHAGEPSSEQSLGDALIIVASQPDVSQKSRKLDNDWIGEIKSSEGHISHLRLERIGIEKGQIFLARIEPDGNFALSDKARLVESLPSPDKLNQLKSISEIQPLLGTGVRGFETWSGPNGTHGNHTWVCVAESDSGTLNYLHVTAEVSYSDEANGKIESIHLAHGGLRIAKHSSEIENLIYLSGEQLFKRRRKQLALTQLSRRD